MPERDYEEFLESLNANGVRYLIVGAHAVAFHARPRATKDIDIFHDPSTDNAERLLAAIREFFGGGDLGFTPSDLMDPDSIVQLGVAPIRVDLLAGVEGIASFEEAWRNKVAGKYGDVSTYYLSLEDTIRAKSASKRSQDKADLAYLIKAQEKQSKK